MKRFFFALLVMTVFAPAAHGEIIDLGQAAPSSYVSAISDSLASVRDWTSSDWSFGESYLRNWGRKLLYVSSGDSVAKIACIGDSWVAGNKIVGGLASTLQSMWGYGGTGYANAATSTNLYNNTVLTKTGAWTNNETGLGLSIGSSASTDSITPAMLSFSVTAKNATIHYLKTPGGGEFQYRIDSGSWTAVDTDTTSTMIRFIDVTGMSLTATHTLEIKVTTKNAAGVTICGVDFWTASGISVMNLGHSGTTTSNWIAADSVAWCSALAKARPAVVTITLGVNDRTAETSISAYKANLRRIIARIRAAYRCDILLLSQGDVGTAHDAPMSDYVAAMREVAALDSCGFIDNLKLLGDYATASAQGMYSDTIHPSDIGGAFIGGVLSQYLQSMYRTPEKIRIARYANNFSIGLVYGSIPLSSTAPYNTSFSITGLRGITSGTHNSVFGYGCGDSLSSGVQNTMYGTLVGPSIKIGSSNSLFGYCIMDSALYYSAGNVAFGSLSLRAARYSNLAYGTQAGRYERGDSAFYLDNLNRANLAGNRRLGMMFGRFSYNPSLRQTLTFNAKVTIGDTTYPAKFTTAGAVADTERFLYIASKGDVRIATIDTLGNAVFADSVVASGYRSTSDGRLKTGVKTAPYGLKEIMAITPRVYGLHRPMWSNGKLSLSDRSTQGIGFVAQELRADLPDSLANMVVPPVNEKTDTYSVNYDALIPVLVRAIQEQQAKILTLEKRVKKSETASKTKSAK